MAIPNPNWPLTSLQVAFNAGLNTGTTPTWTDLTPRMWSLACSRGRQYEIDQNQAGQASIVLADRDENLNPTNPGSPYFPNVLPYRQVAFQAMWPPAPIGAAVNLLNLNARPTAYDPGFESYTVGTAVSWITAVGATSPVVGATTPHTGSQDLTWTVVNGATVQGVSYPVPCIPGQQYTSSVWVQQSSASTQQISIVGGATGTNTTTTGAYVRLSVTFTATQQLHTVQLATTGTAVAGTVLLDDVQHEPGASASANSTTGPVIYGVHRGYVERWPSTWKYQGMYGYAQTQTVDGYAALAARRLHTEYANAILAKSPIYYWRLGEPQGSTSFGETSGNSGPPLVPLNAAQGPGPTFAAGAQVTIAGDPGGTGLNTDTGLISGAPPATVAQTGVVGGPQVGLTVGNLGGSNPLSWSVACWISHTALHSILGNAEFAVSIDKPGFSFFQLYFSDGTPNTLDAVAMWPNGASPGLGDVHLTDSWGDGKPHLFVGVVSVSGATGTLTLYIDGVNVGSNSGAATPGFTNFFATSAQVGGFINGNILQGAPALTNGTYSHLAIYNRALSAGEVTDLWNAGKGFPGETSGARVARYVGYARYGGGSAIDTGVSNMGLSSLAEGTIALDACQAVTISENGNFWVDGTGQLDFYARSRRYNATTSSWTFGENQSGGEYPYEGDVAYDFDPQLVYNDVQVANAGGITARAQDTTSQNNYGPRSLQRSINVLLNPEAIDAANWFLATHKDPRQRIATLTLKPSHNPALWPVALGAEIGQRVTVTRRTTAGYTMSSDYFVERIDHNQKPDEWTTSFQMSPAFWSQAGILDSGSLGRLATSGAQLQSGISAGAVSATVTLTGTDLFTTTGTPFQATIDNEIVTVTAVSGVASPQTFTITRPTNGTAVAHLANAPVQTYLPLVLAY